MDIVVGIVAEDADGEDIGAEDIVEMANQDVDEAVIVAEATHKQLCSNYIWQTQRRIGLSFRCTKSLLRLAISGGAGQKTAYLPLIQKFPQLS
jgi:hypothetical protein